MLVNKIMGAVLAVLLAILGLKTFGDILYGKGHHGGHHAEEEHSINEQLKEKFAYYIELDESGGGEVEEEEAFDLGAELASADIEKGAKSFRSKCASCHTIENGGANGTGPNLYDVVGRAIASHAGFGYTGAMQDYAAAEGNWDYDHLNNFLENPKGTVSGTAMAFAGLRKPPERMNVIAYLASVNPAAPAFPEPLPEEAPEDETQLEEATVDGAVEDAEALVEEGTDDVESLAVNAEAAADDMLDDAETAVEGLEDEAEGETEE